jgi:hypothetical protein
MQRQRRIDPPRAAAAVPSRCSPRLDAAWDCAYFPPARTDAEIARLIDECTRDLCRRGTARPPVLTKAVGGSTPEGARTGAWALPRTMA